MTCSRVQCVSVQYMMYICNSDTVLHPTVTQYYIQQWLGVTCNNVQCVCAVYDEEMVVVQLQNDLAKLEVDVLHTQGHNLRLEQAMKLLNDDINEKIQTIGKYEVCCLYFRSKCASKMCLKNVPHKCSIGYHTIPTIPWAWHGMTWHGVAGLTMQSVHRWPVCGKRGPFGLCVYQAVAELGLYCCMHIVALCDLACSR